MASYKYEVIQQDGKKRKGTIESASKESALTELQSAGDFVVSLENAGALSKDIDIHIGAVVKPRELSIFCRQFQTILSAGVTAISALEMLGEQTENKSFKTAIEDVRDSVQRGETLSDAMAMHPKIFPEMMIHMMAAGEASGSLEVAFERLAVQFEKDAHLKSLIGKALVYPIILICVVIGVVVVMMVKIVPSFTSTFADLDAELPGITKAVMGISDFMVKSWYYIAGGIALFVFLLRAFKKTEHGAMFFGRLNLKLPLFGPLTIKSASARLTRTLSTLVASGITLVDATHIVAKIMDNAVVQKAMERAEREVTQGVALSEPIKDCGIFPPMVHHMIKIGEETGKMESMLDKIADYYDEEVEMATEALVAAMEPLIIIMMAAIVVPIILAILMPMLSMQNAIG